MLLTVALVLIAIMLAYYLYGRPTQMPERLAHVAGGVPYRISLNKYYVDEIYDALIVRPFTAISTWLARIFDPYVIDGAVNGIGQVARGLSSMWRGIQTGNGQDYLVGFLVGTLALLAYYLGQQ